MLPSSREPFNSVKLTTDISRHLPRVFFEERESGSAMIEFVFLGLILLVPVVYLIITLGQLQAGAFAVVGAADQAAKVYVTAPESGSAQGQAEQAVQLAMHDFGFRAEDVTLQINCDPADCQSSGSVVKVSVKVAVPLPLIPYLPGVQLHAATMAAEATQVVGRFR
ncbi:conserved hypothetical protein [Renibacterium salmoninarum ATCC 33209]|uniref:Uncharacterized protein n=1 Tax=Renibacterium salmoninarum (strain ATCC 33209 / DSM 20767 / JCM 11484 / NBRC 15589 / NCIMB 2235) TaxID=288705 RepID=A9WN92_RENSM|nr:hypothetical protein [Renibacterium salmoninarum]ABY23091.1 conserved hypothetical protein [Renibacterium salmoninarum ATCC 33209]